MSRAAHLALLSAALIAALGAQAQQPLPSIIESTGEATVYVSPNRAQFWLHHDVLGDTLAAAVDEAAKFEARLRQALGAREMAQAQVEVAPPAYATAGDTTVRVTARLRFALSPYASEEDGQQRFAALCDSVALLATDLNAALEGPVFTHSDPKLVERQAATRATEDAYVVAEAVAQQLNAVITAVETVSLAGFVWNTDAENRATVPNLREVSCTATVRVVYTLSASQ